MAGRRILFVIERGWRGMREESLALAKKGLFIDIVIKGKVDKGVLEIVSRPNKDYKICAIPRWFFKMYLFFYILWHKISGDLEMVVVSKEKTSNWIKRFDVDVKLLIETDSGYKLG